MSAPLGVRHGLSRLDLTWGAGIMGDVTFDGSQDPDGWTRVGSGSSAVYTYSGTARVLEYAVVTVSAGVTVQPAGCPLFVADRLILGADAQVNASGAHASGSTGGAAAPLVSGAFLGGGSAGRNGVNGGNAGLASTAVSAVGLGARGGAGGTCYRATTNLAGGAAGTVSAYTVANGPPHQGLVYLPFQLAASGTARGGSGGGSGAAVGTSGTSGGGGGGGGVLVVVARRIQQEAGSSRASLAARGGNGGLGTGIEGSGSALHCGGSGGGGGGSVVMLAHTLVGDVSIDVSGGDGSASVHSATAATGADGGNGGSFGSIWGFYAEAAAEPSFPTLGGAGGAAFVGTLGGTVGADGTGTDFVTLARI
jgi:hypothetical protein